MEALFWRFAKVFRPIGRLLGHYGRTCPVSAIPALDFTSAQQHESAHVVGQIHERNLHPRTCHADGAHHMPAHLCLRAKHMLDPHAGLGFLPIACLLLLGERLAARAFLADLAFDFIGLESFFLFLGAICAVGIDRALLPLVVGGVIE